MKPRKFILIFLSTGRMLIVDRIIFFHRVYVDRIIFFHRVYVDRNISLHRVYVDRTTWEAGARASAANEVKLAN